jgi:transposase InsO family protein
MHVDLVGPLPVSGEGWIYLMTMVDRTTRWVEAVPLKGISAESCIEAFISNWVAHYGVPKTVTSDRDSQFSYFAWSSFCARLNMRHAMTMAFHPQANSIVERVHRQLKDSRHARGAGTDWPLHLPWVLLGLRVNSQGD